VNPAYVASCNPRKVRLMESAEALQSIGLSESGPYSRRMFSDEHNEQGGKRRYWESLSVVDER